jgi:hypothetical protein
MLIGVAGRGYPQGASSVVAWAHLALRRARRRLSSLAGLGSSDDSYPGIRCSGFIGAPV